MTTATEKTSQSIIRRERPAPWMHAIDPRDRDRAWEVVLFGARVQPGDED